jgi:CheY-like chemotaxis protein
MSKTILIVDDYPDFACLLESRLKAEGFGTAVALDGPSGIEKALSLKPDLILLDIMMPHVGGTEVRVELMKDPSTQNIPIIFLTGLRAPQTKRKSPGDTFRVIGKSKDFHELLQAIEEELSKAQKV